MNLGQDHPLRLRSPARLAAFRSYLHAFAWLRFFAIRVARDGAPAPHTGQPLVIYSNHPSWWDPAMYMIVGPKLLPGRVGFGPMDARQLQRWQLFRRLGVFGLAPGRQGAAHFLRIARQGLAQPNAALWITAEGAFTDARARPLHLQPGIAHLARAVPNIILLPLAMEYVFWNESRPEVLLRFGAPVAGGPGGIADWNARLTDALTATMDRLAQDSASRDSKRFDILLPGAGMFFQDKKGVLF